MLCSYNTGLADFCFEIGNFQHLFGLFRQRDITHLGCRNLGVGTLLNFLLETE